MKTGPNNGQRGTHSAGLCGTKGIHPHVCPLALFSGLMLHQTETDTLKLLLTAAPSVFSLRIVRQDLFEIIKQPKFNQNLVDLLRHCNSYTGSVNRVVCFV